MLRWALAFFIVAVVAALLGFTGIAVATAGIAKIHVRAGSDQIVGATIVAAHAGEIISELTLAVAAGIGLGRIAAVIHPYPTQAEAIKKIADAYNRTRLTPSRKRLLTRLLAWRRR